ncbi:MAG: hypothetical protein NXI24_17065 [bacterium]|nr:hypothetical protein [bacterium]
MKQSNYRMRRFACVLAAGCALSLSGLRCTFGDTANSQTEGESLASFLLTVIGVNGTGSLRLRFGDGGTDGINQFTTAAGTVVLGDAVWFDIEKIDVYAGQQSGSFPLAPASYYIDRALMFALSPIRPLAAHEENVTPAPGVTITETGQDIFVQPLSSGNSGNGQDSLGRFFLQAPEIRVALPPGGIQRVVVHIRRMQLNGTIGGNAYSVLYQVNSDYSVAPRCNTTVTSNATTGMDLYFDYSLLFRNVTGANSASVNSAFAANIPAGGILSESECFVL